MRQKELKEQFRIMGTDQGMMDILTQDSPEGIFLFISCYLCCPFPFFFFSFFFKTCFSLFLGLAENAVVVKNKRRSRKSWNEKEKEASSSSVPEEELPFQSAINALSMLGKRDTPSEKLVQIILASKEIELNTSLPT